MSNHFHMVCFVPKAKSLSVDEVLERIGALYGPERVQKLRALQTRLAELPDGLELFDRQLDKYRRRMNDLSIFIKELKGTFAQWYNRQYNRYGALWAERFKSVLLEGGQALAAVVAYVSLNPVRAGLCEDPRIIPTAGMPKQWPEERQKPWKEFGSCWACRRKQA